MGGRGCRATQHRGSIVVLTHRASQHRRSRITLTSQSSGFRQLPKDSDEPPKALRRLTTRGRRPRQHHLQTPTDPDSAGTLIFGASIRFGEARDKASANAEPRRRTSLNHFGRRRNASTGLVQPLRQTPKRFDRPRSTTSANAETLRPASFSHFGKRRNALTGLVRQLRQTPKRFDRVSLKAVEHVETFLVT